jgi:hypothetical protein
MFGTVARLDLAGSFAHATQLAWTLNEKPQAPDDVLRIEHEAGG